MLGLALVLAGCGDPEDRGATVVASTNASDPASLVSALRESGTLAEATAAAHALLTRAGVPIVDVRGTAVGTATAPIVPYQRTPIQLLQIAGEARARTTRLTLEETAALLEALGFPLAPLATVADDLRVGAPDSLASAGDDGAATGEPAPAAARSMLPQVEALLPQAEVREAQRALEEAERQMEARLREVPAAMRPQVEAQLRDHLAETRRSLAAVSGGGAPPSPRRSTRATADPERDARVAGANLARVLRHLVLDARERPDDPDTWPARALDALAQAELPAVDLGSPHVDPAQLRWGLLEMELLSAVFARVAEPGPLAALPRSGATFHFAALQAPPNPCGVLQQAVSGLDGATGVAAGWGVKKAGGKVGDALVKAYGPQGTEKVLKQLQLFSQILALAEFYAMGGVEVTLLTEDPTHKVVEGSPGRKARFQARAGVDRDLADAYEELMRDLDPAGVRQIMSDCGKMLGLPSFESPESLRDKVKDWRIEWDVEVQPEGLATWSLADNALTLKGATVMPLQSTGRGTGTAVLTVDIGEERKQIHEDRSSRQRTGHVRVTAKVKSSEPPPASTFIPNRVPIGEIVGLTGGLIRELATPESQATL
ncbi:MAG TPA: hypothetical protein VFX39_04840, partial [Gemmatimonadaceae bacterium]|nr:hypothetical protein [Gemmatimonadaceae bacterium]